MEEVVDAEGKDSSDDDEDGIEAAEKFGFIKVLLLLLLLLLPLLLLLISNGGCCATGAALILAPWLFGSILLQLLLLSPLVISIYLG